MRRTRLSVGFTPGIIARRQAPRKRLSASSALLGEQAAKPLEVQRPTALAANRLTLSLPALTVTVKIAVLELDSGAVRRLGDKPNLDLACLLDVRLKLPLRAYVPTDHHPGWRLK